MISRRTAILASAVLAAGAFGMTSSISFAQATGSQTPGHTNTSGTNSTANRSTIGNQADSQNEVKGVQDLFAKATEAAVKPNGEQELKALFAQYSDTGTNQTENRQREHAANSNTTGGTGATSGGTSGLSARAGSNSNSGSSGNANERNSPTGGTNATAGRNTNEASGSNATSGRNSNEASGSNHMADQQALNQTIQQFQQDWKQKYGSNFTIQNPAMVFADISATDIMRGQAQTAGERIGGSSSTNGNANERTTGTGTSPTGGIHANTGGATGGTAGANEQGRLGNRNGNSSGSMNEQLTVDVPPVSGSQAVKINLVREGPSNFKFASENKVQMQQGQQAQQGQQMQQMHLSSALEKHLKEVVDQKAQWPSDQQKAQRLVTQHVLMAISECQSGNMNENAQPASSRIQGQTEHNTPSTPHGGTR
jgi:hypothetical protein